MIRLTDEFAGAGCMTNGGSTAQDAVDEFHMMMGYCIAAWARVEDQLFRICHAALKAPKEQAAVVYYRTPQLDARLSLIKELVCLILPRHDSGESVHEDLKVWQETEKQIRGLTPVRNRIAHYPVARRQSTFYLDVSYLDVEPESWFEIYESENERLRGKGTTRSPLRLPDLQSHLRAVEAVSETLDRFYRERILKHV